MEPYIGEIRIFAGTFAPRGWLLCDGTAIDSNRYASLYSLIGTLYGGNDHMFQVPDLRGRAPIQWGKGDGLSGHQIGEKAGAEQVTLSVPQLPAHNHGLQGVIAAGDAFSPENNYLSIAVDNQGQNPIHGYQTKSDTSLALKNLKADSILPTGGNVPVATLSPVLTVTYIIAYEGIYPSKP